ncbi:gamma-glutamylcyclotransferase [Pelagibacterium xiamenense]|uniref:gamma-glutamylcyclotransferase n=1 Tax=Pelagibacterium xiamenense TaxID=2901140 RepID=UPI001E4FB67E|nr:gamma-glutamylcyclotransferase [Pelagibacterium xiamenense]MCD7061291.1 gamma-glutamylcyclotransferase [Pelagibacterium xiamenense]
MSTDSAIPWVFGYGSLIWRPGFPFEASDKALLRGAHRRLCVISHHHRGTPDNPGLVFGLERGGSCVGMAYRVSPENWSQVHAYLREREQVTGVYKETLRRIRLASGEAVTALVYLVDPSHEQYAGRLSLAEQLALVRDAHGTSGANRDYVVNTAEHLLHMGILDRPVLELSAMLQAERKAG